MKYQTPICYYNLDTMRWVFGRMSSLLLIKLNSVENCSRQTTTTRIKAQEFSSRCQRMTVFKLVIKARPEDGSLQTRHQGEARGWQSSNSSSRRVLYLIHPAQPMDIFWRSCTLHRRRLYFYNPPGLTEEDCMLHK